MWIGLERSLVRVLLRMVTLVLELRVTRMMRTMTGIRRSMTLKRWGDEVVVWMMKMMMRITMMEM